MPETRPPSDRPGNLPVAVSPTFGSSALVAGGRQFAPPGHDDEAPFPWARYVDGLKRNWWIVVALTMLGSVGGLYLKRHAVPLYQVEAKIWITRRNNPQDRSGPIRAPQFLSSSTWEELLRSNSIIDPVVRRLSLNIAFRNPADSALARVFGLDSAFQAGTYRLEVDTLGKSFTLSKDKLGVIDRGVVGDSIGREIGFLWAPGPTLLTPGRVVLFGVSTLRGTSNSLKSRLYTSIPGEGGQVMNLRLAGADPARTAATLNEWARQFVAAADELTKGNTVKLRDVMLQQLVTVEGQLNAAEAALLRFRERVATLPSDNPGSSGNANLFRTLSTRDSLQGNIAALERILRDANDTRDGAVTPESFYATPGVLSGPGSTQLSDAVKQLTAAQSDWDAKRKVFTDSSLAVVTARATRDTLAKQTIPRIVSGMIAALRAQDQNLAVEVDTVSRALRAAPARSLEEQRLRRNYDQTGALYSQLKADYDRVRLAEPQTFPDLQIQQEAEVPQTPTSNSGPKMFLLAAMMGFGAGIGLALLRAQLDRHFRHPEQATMELGLTIVGTVPTFRTNRRGDLSISAMSQVVESFRALRLSVRHHFPPDQPVVLCVSSPGPGEGKSLVSSNLAIAFANSGHRTLLIDGDVRRGVVHTTFELQRRPGLVDFLAGSSGKDAIIHTTSTENLSVITSGARSRKAPELLVSDHLLALVRDMRETFEVVIIDSAPFAAGMDAYALGAASGATLVVLRPGVTDRKLAAAKLEILDRLPVVVLGAVLNGISGHRELSLLLQRLLRIRHRRCR